MCITMKYTGNPNTKFKIWSAIVKIQNIITEHARDLFFKMSMIDIKLLLNINNTILIYP